MEPLPFSAEEMAPLPTTLEPPPDSKPLGALPDGDTPVKRLVKKSRTVRLSTEQLLAHSADAAAVGATAAARNVVGREARALTSLLAGLARWAEKTEPRLSLAGFVVDMQRAAKCRVLRREVADRRTAAFRRAVAGKEDEAGEGAVNETEGAEEVETADWDTLTPVANRVAPALEEDVDLDDVVDGGRPVAQMLDMDVDVADVMPAQGPAAPVDEEEDDDYELDLLREMEMGESEEPAPVPARTVEVPKAAPEASERTQTAEEPIAVPEAPVPAQTTEDPKVSPVRKRPPPSDDAEKNDEENDTGASGGKGRSRKLRKLADMADPFTEEAIKAHSALVAAKYEKKKASPAATSKPQPAATDLDGKEPCEGNTSTAPASAPAANVAPSAYPPAEADKSAVEKALAATALADEDEDEDDLDVLREFEEGG